MFGKKSAKLEAELAKIEIERDRAMHEVEAAAKKANAEQKKIATLEENIASLTERLEAASASNDLLRETVETLEEQVRAITTKTKNSVTILIEDDLTTVKPVIRYKESSLEKLLELGYLRETGDKVQDGFAIQLALMEIAKDALSQITESFVENVE